MFIKTRLISLFDVPYLILFSFFNYFIISFQIMIFKIVIPKIRINCCWSHRFCSNLLCVVLLLLDISNLGNDILTTSLGDLRGWGLPPELVLLLEPFLVLLVGVASASSSAIVGSPVAVRSIENKCKTNSNESLYWNIYSSNDIIHKSYYWQNQYFKLTLWQILEFRQLLTQYMTKTFISVLLQNIKIIQIHPIILKLIICCIVHKVKT